MNLCEQETYANWSTGLFSYPGLVRTRNTPEALAFLNEIETMFLAN